MSPAPLALRRRTLATVGAPLPLAFTSLATSPSSTDLGSSQGVTANDAEDTFYLTGGPSAAAPGISGKSILKYDSSWNYITSQDYAGAGFPGGYSESNGITYDRAGGRLFVGGNNYSTTPRSGTVIEVTPSTLALIASHDMGLNHSEGGAIRPGTNEFWSCCNDSTVIRRWDATTSTWSLTNSYTGGFTGTTADAYYQGLTWWSPTIFLCPLHGSQVSPPRIDVYSYDPVGDTITPLYRMARPSTASNQGFDFNALRTKAFFAERDGGGAGVDRVVTATVSSVKLRNRTINTGSSQRTGLIHWYPELLWDGSAITLVDQIGSTNGVPNASNSYVFPLLNDDGNLWAHFRGANAGSRIDFGNLFPSALTSYTISFWYKHLDTSVNLPIFNGNASGTNIGDWAITANVTDPGRIQVTTTAVGATTARSLTTDLADAMVVGSYYLITVTQDGSGMVIYINGVSKKTNALTGQISGTSQNTYMGALFTGSGNQMDVRDLRIADSAMTSGQVAALYAAATKYDMWVP